jgi:hypothetical protein
LVAAGTIVAKNRLADARVLAKSFLNHHPETPFFVLLADEPDGCFDPALEGFPVLRLSDLGIPNLTQLCFQYSQQELSYAVTPYLLDYILNQGCRGAVFLKQESLVLGNMQEIFARFESSSILLTPHLLEPLAGPGAPERELNILLAGAYNGGFLGVAATETGRRFLDFWKDRLARHCRHEVGAGMHFEQHWLDLIPAYFDDVHIVRSPGMNVGHWNLPERDIQIDGDRVLACGTPCLLFRFSGFDPHNPENVTIYFSRLTMANVGPSAELFRRYRLLLERAGYHETKAWPYSYGVFHNGVAIPDSLRRTYRDLGEDADQFGDPFDVSGPDTFYRWVSGRE